MGSSPRLWAATYKAKNMEDLAGAYRKWAGMYDRDTRQVMGYVGPETAAAMLDHHLDSRECRVLDAGCGTGLVGEVLNRMGYVNVDGMDFSTDFFQPQ